MVSVQVPSGSVLVKMVSLLTNPVHISALSPKEAASATCSVGRHAATLCVGGKQLAVQRNALRPEGVSGAMEGVGEGVVGVTLLLHGEAAQLPLLCAIARNW